MSVISDKSTSELIDEITRAPDLRTVLAVAAEGLGNILGVSRVVVMLYSPKDKPVRAPVEWSLEPPEEGYDLELIRFAQFIQKNTVFSEQILEISNTYINPICHPVRPQVLKLGVQSVLASPTYYKGEANGTLILNQTGRFRRWSSREVSLLSVVAYFVGIAIHHHMSAQERKAAWNFLPQAC